MSWWNAYYKNHIISLAFVPRRTTTRANTAAGRWGRQKQKSSFTRESSSLLFSNANSASFSSHDNFKYPDEAGDAPPRSFYETTAANNNNNKQSMSNSNRIKHMTLSPSSSRPRPSALFATKYAHSNHKSQQRDIVIVGGGLAGLSTALYVQQLDPSRHVTILDKEEASTQRTTVASMAAAGMLAPQSERLPRGPLLDLCMASRRIYADFCQLVESCAQQVGPEGEHYLQQDAANDSLKDQHGLEPWSVGYVSSGGFLAPAFAGDSVATWAPPEESGTAQWLDEIQARELEPNLHPDVVGAWWFPEDASVDARRLTRSLRAACVAQGVQILHGPSYEVTSLDLADGLCKGIWLKNGKYIQANSVLLANGAWIRNLLPVPVEPHKGQSLSLRMPKGEPILRRVLFAQDSYIVPKADGRIVVGATVEAGSYDPNVTPAGLMHIMTHALQLVPALKDLPVEETWVGLRPTTPDKGPILGKTPWSNLFLGAGYWRNGVLLAPKTGQLLASLLTDTPLDKEDLKLVEAFAWDRFTSKEGGAKLVADSRYAASMHPIHNRKSGTGVAASVGTELGSYSSARSATEERARDRSSLWGDDDMESEFEKAAAMGQKDGRVYTFDEKKNVNAKTKDDGDEEEASLVPYEGSADAYTVHSLPYEPEDGTEPLASTDDTRIDLQSTYQKIIANKQKVNHDFDDEEEEKPDPGFRIYFVDEENGEKHEIPPYTSPGEFMESLELRRKATSGNSSLRKGETPADSREEEYSEKTFDGYTLIQEANKRATREEELEAMRKARQSNRLGQSSIDESKIGVRKMD